MLENLSNRLCNFKIAGKLFPYLISNVFSNNAFKNAFYFIREKKSSFNRATKVNNKTIVKFDKPHTGIVAAYVNEHLRFEPQIVKPIPFLFYLLVTTCQNNRCYCGGAKRPTLV